MCQTCQTNSTMILPIGIVAPCHFFTINAKMHGTICTKNVQLTIFYWLMILMVSWFGWNRFSHRCVALFEPRICKGLCLLFLAMLLLRVLNYSFCYGRVWLRFAVLLFCCLFFLGPNNLETQRNFTKCILFCCDPHLDFCASDFSTGVPSQDDQWGREYFLCVHAVHRCFGHTIESKWYVFDGTESWCCFIGPCLCTHTTWCSFASKTWSRFLQL